MPETNLSVVEANLLDVHGKTIRDQVQLTFVNQALRSLDRRLKIEFRGAPISIPDIPAQPTGLYQVFITPKKYREKSIFLSVPSGSPAHIDESFFVEPNEVTPVMPDYATLESQERWADLIRLLRESQIDAQKYAALSDFQKAGLLNLYAKMQAQNVTGDQGVWAFADRVVGKEIKPARLLVLVKNELLSLVRNFQEGFHTVPGALHDFPTGWARVDPSGSFKTFDRAGNLQLTFAQNGQGAFLVDADIDDHQGVKHAFDVVKHTFTGRDTHPYDIHQILVFFQGIDPGYDFV